MNSLRKVVKSDNGNAIASLDRRDVLRIKTIHVLSVGPVDRGNFVHDALLELANFRLSIATDYSRLWAIPKHERIHAVVIHCTFSLSELKDSCRLIRRRWPHAGILVVHQGEGFLDDALYDDRVAPTVAPEVLLTTIERLTEEEDWRRFGNAEL